MNKRKINTINWLKWSDLTGKEKECAIECYKAIREYEEEYVCSYERASNNVVDCRFERMEDGCIYVDL
jgi:hypothetical protein